SDRPRWEPLSSEFLGPFPGVSHELRSATPGQEPLRGRNVGNKAWFRHRRSGLCAWPLRERSKARPGFVCAMLDFLDHLLLRPGIALDDCSLAFRRIEGNPRSKVVYFLPLQTSFSVARQAGFLPLDFLAAYEMPNAIASSEPDLCLQAMRALV